LEEQPLAGGFDGAHPVVRVGDTVRRPARQSSEAVRALLTHLERVGFTGAPRLLGIDEQGRDIVSFVDGDVPIPPYPEWLWRDDALVALGKLLARYHAAVASFDHEGVAGWETDWSDPRGAGVLCHNDPFPENVVFRNGVPFALIDFDMSAPGRPWWDVAIAAQEWSPLKADSTDDAVRRFGLLARAYGIAQADAETFVAVLFEQSEHAVANMRNEVALGTPVWVENFDEDRAAADARWLAEHRAALIAAVRA
jgi:Ser/Thr protein kinase RdoA (MazF antagonist)